MPKKHVSNGAYRDLLMSILPDGKGENLQIRQEMLQFLIADIDKEIVRTGKNEKEDYAKLAGLKQSRQQYVEQYKVYAPGIFTRAINIGNNLLKSKREIRYSDNLAHWLNPNHSKIRQNARVFLNKYAQYSAEERNKLIFNQYVDNYIRPILQEKYKDSKKELDVINKLESFECYLIFEANACLRLDDRVDLLHLREEHDFISIKLLQNVDTLNSREKQNLEILNFFTHELMDLINVSNNIVNIKKLDINDVRRVADHLTLIPPQLHSDNHQPDVIEPTFESLDNFSKITRDNSYSQKNPIQKNPDNPGFEPNIDS